MNLLEGFHDAKRVQEILHVLAKHELSFLVKSARHERGVKPKELCYLLQDLGGTFIKLGQMLSLREDLIPQEYCKELAKLQDHVPIIPVVQVKKVLSAQYEKSPFKAFEEKPLASASIGQVHKAVLHDGTIVAVKVQRPGIREKMTSDLHLLALIANYYEKKIKLFSAKQIFQEFERYTQEELDYRNEGRNLEDFQALNLLEESPNYYRDYSSEDVLVMSFITGTKISLVTKNRQALMKRLVESMLEQIFEHGVFHADPHPGNILVQKTQKLAYLDLGVLGRLPPARTSDLKNLFLHVVMQDEEGIVTNLEALGFTPSRLNKEKLGRDINEAIGHVYGKRLKELNIGLLLQTALTTARKYNLHVDKNYVLLAKAVLTLEGLGKNLDPNFNFITFAQPYVIKHTATLSPTTYARSLYKQAKYTMKFLANLPSEREAVLKSMSENNQAVVVMSEDVRLLTSNVRVISRQVMLLGVLTFLLFFSYALINAIPKILGMSVYSAVGFLLSILLIADLYHTIRKT